MATTQSSIPANYRVTPQQLEKAAKRGQYVRISSTGKKPSFVSLSGATKGKGWKNADPEQNQKIFLPTVRLAGTTEAVSQALRHLGYQDSQIQGFFDQAFTSQNFNLPGVRERFEAELLDYKKRKGAQEPTLGFSLGYLKSMYDNLKEDNYRVEVPDKQGKTVGTKGKRATGQPRSTLAEKYNKVISEGKVLDVSKMDLTTGVRATSGKATENPKKKKRSTKLAIVSDNLPAYQAAINLIFDRATLSQEENADLDLAIAEFTQELAKVGTATTKKAKTPKATKAKKTGAKSPRKTKSPKEQQPLRAIEAPRSSVQRLPPQFQLPNRGVSPLRQGSRQSSPLRAPGSRGPSPNRSIAPPPSFVPVGAGGSVPSISSPTGFQNLPPAIGQRFSPLTQSAPGFPPIQGLQQ